MKTLVLCPSRGRPQKAGELRDSFLATRAMDDTRLLFVLDQDDITADTYERIGLDVIRVDPPQRGMTAALNMGLASVIDVGVIDAEIIGFVGDDHRFRTVGWDATFYGYHDLEGPGIFYGNDLFRANGDIPTHWFVSKQILKALGYLALPHCRHLYLDNAWRVIGDEADCLYYFPDVVIEHMHPLAGKAEWDSGYQFVNSPDMYSGDERAFIRWLRAEGPEPHRDSDVAKVRAAIKR